MLLRPRRTGSGYAAAFAIGVDLSDTEVGDDDRPDPGRGWPAA